MKVTVCTDSCMSRDDLSILRSALLNYADKLYDTCSPKNALTNSLVWEQRSTSSKPWTR